MYEIFAASAGDHSKDQGGPHLCELPPEEKKDKLVQNMGETPHLPIYFCLLNWKSLMWYNSALLYVTYPYPLGFIYISRARECQIWGSGCELQKCASVTHPDVRMCSCAVAGACRGWLMYSKMNHTLETVMSLH